MDAFVDLDKDTRLVRVRHSYFMREALYFLSFDQGPDSIHMEPGTET